MEVSTEERAVSTRVDRWVEKITSYPITVPEGPTAAACRLCGGRFTGALTIDRAPAGAQLFSKEANEKSGTTLKVVQCISCGLIQLDNEPVPYYRSTITAAGLSPEMRAVRTMQFGTLMQEFGLKNRKVAEVGAAKGLFTDLLNDIGMDAVGIEGSLEADSTTPGGRPLLSGYPDRPLPGAAYAGFACINFLEHSPHPVDFLRNIAASLEPGAVGIVEIPAFEHMLEANLSYDWVADHLSYFTENTLLTALLVSGFDVLKIERVWHGYDWAATVRLRTRPDLSDMRESLAKCVRSLLEFVLPRAGRIAVWGASHQALTLLSQARLTSSEIPFIIDSAPFKQGTFAPGCGIPVVAPSRIAESGVESVLVMAGGYSEEIAKGLHGRLRFDGEIAIYSDGSPRVL